MNCSRAIIELAALREEIRRLQATERKLCATLRAIAEDEGGELRVKGCPLRILLMERGRPGWKVIAQKVAALHYGKTWRRAIRPLVEEHTTEIRAVALRPNVALGRKQPEKVGINRAKRGAR